MATAMTFTSLLVDLKSYLERGSITDVEVLSQLPALINRAERQISRELKVLGFIRVVTSTLKQGVSSYPKPDRWRDTVSMRFGVGLAQVSQSLFPRSYEYCRYYWPDEDLTEVPEFYADFDYKHWLISPTPDQDYPWEISFYELPALLDSTNQTNWLTDYAPNLLLHATLLLASPYLKNDERIPTWERLYMKDLSTLQNEDLQKIVDRSTTRQEA